MLPLHGAGEPAPRPAQVSHGGLDQPIPCGLSFGSLYPMAPQPTPLCLLPPLFALCIPPTHFGNSHLANLVSTPKRTPRLLSFKKTQCPISPGTTSILLVLGRTNSLSPSFGLSLFLCQAFPDGSKLPQSEWAIVLWSFQSLFSALQ